MTEDSSEESEADSEASAEETEAEDAEEEEEPEESREVEYEHYLSREEVLEHFDAFLDGLREGETVSMTIGDETVEIDVPEHMNFELEYEEYGDERELEFELEWEVRSEDLDIESGE